MRFTPPLSSLRQLQYAVAVADTRSFRRAAELCRVAQPSLSAQLAQLEQALGTRLFDRDRRGVLPTRAGVEVIARARAVLLAAADLEETAARLHDPLSGTLRVGVIPTVSPYLLPRVVPALARELRRLSILWTEEKTDTLVERINAGELDGALLAVEAPLGELERQVVGRDPFVLATPMAHPLGKARGPVRLDELRDAQVLLLDEGHCLRDQALDICGRARAHELDFRATSLSTLCQMVASGAGVTLLPALAVPIETRRAKVRIRELRAPAPARTLAVVWRRGAASAPALQALAQVVAGVLAPTERAGAPAPAESR